MSAGVILLAAGSGRRFGGRVSKQFLELNKVPLFLYSLRAFLQSSHVREIVITVAPEKVRLTQKLLSEMRTSKNILVVAGGDFRGQSVQRGYQALKSIHDVILVHDAARPLVTTKIIDDVYQAARKSGVALAAWPLADTLKLSSSKSFVKKTVPRKDLWLAQTPQGFSRKTAALCLNHPWKSATDDVALAERRGLRVALVPASPTNIKVTYPTDFKLAAALLKK